jgi:putative inorganic carbon (HCO3(-)) transporter
MFVSNPFLGVGAGNYPNNYQHYAQAIGIELRSEQRDAHSLYIQVLAEEGIVGAIPFLGILILLLDRLSKTRRLIEDSRLQHDWLPWVSSIQISLIAYLTAGFFLHGAYIRYFWILAALALVAIQLTDAMLKERDHSFTVEVSAE